MAVAVAARVDGRRQRRGASVHAGGAEEALEQLAAAGLSQRCGTRGSVASGRCREETVGEEKLVYPVGEGLGDFKNLLLKFFLSRSLSLPFGSVVIFLSRFLESTGIQTGPNLSDF